jgi:hypothetical protein
MRLLGAFDTFAPSFLAKVMIFTQTTKVFFREYGKLLLSLQSQ